MTGKRALVDYRKCDPATCEGGVCIAARACPKKILYQEEPGEAPLTNPGNCKGCSECARVCPLGAIKVTH